MDQHPIEKPFANATTSVAATSELNNLLQIIGGTTELMENIWDGNPDSEKYLLMLRASVDRASRITAQLVEHAGGVNKRILLHPNLGEGAPVRPARTTTAERPAKILLVDDEPDGLLLFQKFLSQAGYEIVTASSGFECLDLLSRTPDDFDLVVLDFCMPFMDGEETFRRIQTVCAAVPVVLSTGFIHQQRLDAMLAAGLAGFMRKPLPPDEVTKHIAAVLEAAKGQTEPIDPRGIAAAL